MIRVCEICTVVPASHIALFDVTGSPTHPQPSRSDLEGHDSPVTRPPTQILLYGDMEWGGPQFVPWNLYVHAAAHFRYCTDNQLALHRRVNGAARAIKDVAITRLRWRGGVSGRGSWVARWHYMHMYCAHVTLGKSVGITSRPPSTQTTSDLATMKLSLWGSHPFPPLGTGLQSVDANIIA